MFIDSLVTRHAGSLFRPPRAGTRPIPSGDAPALRSASRTWSYAEVSGLLATLAAELVAANVAPGDRVLIQLPSGPEFVVALFATTVVGAIAVPVPLSVGPERLAYITDTTRASIVLVADEMPAPTGVRRLVVCLEALLARPPAVLVRHPDSNPDDVAVILFSSGSTGRPKGVPLTHHQLLAAARHLAETYRFGANHRELVVAPMCHSDGWQRTAAALYMGGLVAVSEGMLSVRALLAEIRGFGATGLFIPPPLVPFLVRTARQEVAFAFESCRTIEIGSAMFAPGVIRALLARMPEADLFVHYGLTECSRAVVLDVRAHADKVRTVGRPALGVALSIRDDAGRPVPPNTTGQVYLRGPQQCTSYYARPDLDAERFADSWLATGDFASMDEDGFVSLLGRRDDMVTSGGYHFFPAEVETELGPVDGIADYVIAGIADPAGVMGQVLWAFVVPVNGATFKPRSFVEAARLRLAPHMRPRKVVVVPELQRTPSGKPDRRKMGEACSQ